MRTVGRWVWDAVMLALAAVAATVLVAIAARGREEPMKLWDYPVGQNGR